MPTGRFIGSTAFAISLPVAFGGKLFRGGLQADSFGPLPAASPWDLTFDMSGGGRPAKPAGRRPLDGGVRHQGPIPSPPNAHSFGIPLRPTEYTTRLHGPVSDEREVATM